MSVVNSPSQVCFEIRKPLGRFFGTSCSLSSFRATIVLLLILILLNSLPGPELGDAWDLLGSILFKERMFWLAYAPQHAQEKLLPWFESERAWVELKQEQATDVGRYQGSAAASLQAALVCQDD